MPIVEFTPSVWSHEKIFIRNDGVTPAADDCVSIYGIDCSSILEAKSASDDINTNTTITLPTSIATATMRSTTTTANTTANTVANVVAKKSNKIIFWIHYLYLHDMIHIGCKNKGVKTNMYEPELQNSQCAGCARARKWYELQQNKKKKT